MNKKILFVVLATLLVALAVSWKFLPHAKVAVPAPVAVFTQGVTDTEILLGSSVALSGTAASLGINLLSGAEIAVKEINDAGGINGRTLRIISYDDQYDPPKAIENTQKLINDDKVFALCNYAGTPTGVKVAPLVAEAHIPLVGMFTGAEVFRNPPQKYIFNIRGSYYQETELAVRYFVDNLGMKNVAVLYQADAFGLAGLEGVKIALGKRGLKTVALGSYERGTSNVETAVQTIAESDAQVVIMIGTYSPLAKSVRLIKAQKSTMQFDTVSFVGPENFIKEVGTSTANIFVTQVVPPTDSSEQFPIVKSYHEGLLKYASGTLATFGGLEGYINTKILAEGILRTGKTPTREGLVTALESMNNYDAGIGVPVTFSPTSHQGLDKVFLTNYINNNFVLVSVK